MNPANSSLPTTTTQQRLVRIALALVILLFIGNTAWSIYILRTTGRLVVSSPSTDATISISQNNREAKVIGSGTANVRLQPGRYTIVGSSAGAKSKASVTIQQGRTTNLRLKEETPPVVPSAANIKFSGTQALVDQGITIEQVVVLQKLFFKYNTGAQTITIDTGSVTNGTRKPDSNEPFTLIFTGKVDQSSYRATVAYTGLEELQLTIYDPSTDAQLFQDGILEVEPPIYSEEGDSQ